MNQYKEHAVLILSLFLPIFSFVLLSTPIKKISSSSLIAEKKPFTVVIDAGHGGFDSGKVGIDGTLEKNVNLEIAKQLEKLLTAADVHVIMTRTEDRGLCEDSSDNKKRQDMVQRANLMNEASADCIVSIHQNSYPDPSIDGAQVFYYENSEDGSTLSQLIQQELIRGADPTNHRKPKSNNSYYLLKNVSSPIAIVECGFLSNPEESKKLVDDAYQQKLAWTIHLGILKYLNNVVIN